MLCTSALRRKKKKRNKKALLNQEKKILALEHLNKEKCLVPNSCMRSRYQLQLSDDAAACCKAAIIGHRKQPHT